MTPGTQVGPYRVIAQIGVGGMGEVYRAEDQRLGRAVALKVLPADFAGDPDRLRRFEQEGRAIGALSHPNVMAVFDVGSYEGSPYLVSELLEGETLRQRLDQGGLGLRQAVDFGLQVARGLAAAHAKGIVHRDLKPENLFITLDGMVKILDFGLAKGGSFPGELEGLTGPAFGTAAPIQTVAGMILGSVNYMAPEQLRGEPVDPRSDIFALGVVLFEMVTGERPFRGGSTVEVMSAILKEPPKLFGLDSGGLPPALERLVLHCLEKQPEARFQSTRDLVFDLETLAGSSLRTDVLPSGERRAVLAPTRPGRSRAWMLAVGAGLMVVAAFFVRKPAKPLRFERITYRQGKVWGARFTQDGRGIVYGASWGDEPLQLYANRLGSHEYRPLGIPGATLLSLSHTEEMALQLRASLDPSNFWIRVGALGRSALAGGAPKEVLEDVQAADWDPKGEQLAVVRASGGKATLEYPPGTPLVESQGWLSHPRFSPDGRWIAYAEHPVPGDDRGSLFLVNPRTREQQRLSGEWGTIQGIAWGPGGEEVWFSALNGSLRSLRAAKPGGKERELAVVPGVVTLQDVTRDGRALMTYEFLHSSVLVQGPAEQEARDVSQFNWSTSPSLSADGRSVTFAESGVSPGPNYDTYLRRVDGTSAIHLGKFSQSVISPDGSWVAATQKAVSPRPRLMLVPTGPGQPKALETPPFETLTGLTWMPDGRALLYAASEGGKPPSLWLHPLGGHPRPLPSETSAPAEGGLPNPTGTQILARTSPDGWEIHPLAGGAALPVRGLQNGEKVIAWSPEGRGLLVFRPGTLPLTSERLDLATGNRTPFRTFHSRAFLGAYVNRIQLTPDGRSYALRAVLERSNLYLLEGLGER